MAAEDLYQRLGKEYPAGHVLFQDGDVGDQMFVIHAGAVRISKSVRGVDKTLVVLGPGEFFGEMSILNSQPRSAKATIESQAKLLVIGPKIFEAMLQGNAEIAVRMIKKLATRLREADKQIENLLLPDPSSRIVHFLATAASQSQSSAEPNLRLPFTATEMGHTLGIEADVVATMLTKLARSKLLVVEAESLVVPEVAKLQAFLQFLEMKEKFGDV